MQTQSRVLADGRLRRLTLLRRLVDDRDGASTFEYLMLAVVVLFLAGVVRALSGPVADLFEAETRRVLSPHATNGRGGVASPYGPRQSSGRPQPGSSPAGISRGSTANSAALYFGDHAPDLPPIGEYAQRALDWGKSLVRSANRRIVGGVYDMGDRVPDPIKDGALDGLEAGVGVVDRAAGFADRQLDKLPSGVKDRIPEPVKRAYGKAQEIIGGAETVNFEAFRDDRGLKGDWYRFYKVWIAESTPSDLGTWNAAGDTVTITDPAYAADLASRNQHQVSLALFFQKHGTDLSKIPPGTTMTTKFEYVGPNTVEGSTYGALESVMGSYRTTLVYQGVDPVTGQAKFVVEVVNEARWGSGTRLPSKLQVLGADHLLDDRPRNSGVGVGGDYFQKFVWQQDVSPSTNEPRVGISDDPIADGAVTVCGDNTLESDCVKYDPAQK